MQGHRRKSDPAIGIRDDAGRHEGCGKKPVGGAIVPVIQGILADSFGIQLAFILPVMCYAYIAYYGARGHRPAFARA